MKQLLLTLVLYAALDAGDIPPLRSVLEQAGRAAERSWTDLLAVNCNESVVQSKFGKSRKVAVRQETRYDYLLVAHLSPGDLRIEESRMKVAGAAAKSEAPLLATSGFSTLLLVFHPFFQGSYEYAQPVEDTLDGASVLRVAFRQVRGARSPSCLRLRGRDYPLEWRGNAWIGALGTLRRVQVELNTSMEDVGLSSLTADVRYEPVEFKDAGRRWLPSTAEIDAATPRQHWHNTHRFTNYKRFSVETTTTTEAPR